MRDIAPVASIADAPYVVVINPSLPAQDLLRVHRVCEGQTGQDQHRFGRQRRLFHIFGELLKAMAGVELVHVPYRGSFMPDPLAGQVHMTINPIPQATEYIATCKIARRGGDYGETLAGAGGHPTVNEFVPGYEATGWYGLCVPRSTPAEIVNALNTATNAALADPKAKARLASLGVEPMINTPAGFGKFIA
jgi:tripartite-type tricarboxylate transporter receptor subunit TctC